MGKKHLLLRTGLLTILAILAFSACKPSVKQSDKKGAADTAAEDFDRFYDRFHTDSLFQFSRLKFPLEGSLDTGETEEHWTKENWSMLKTRIYDVDTTKYRVSYRKFKNSFIEKVWIEDTGFRFECRFELIDNQWFLVYAYEANN